MGKNGEPTGETSEKLPVQGELILGPAPDEKAIFIKLSPGTDLYVKVKRVAKIADVKPSKAGRMMMRNGWLGFRRFLAEEGFRVSK